MYRPGAACIFPALEFFIDVFTCFIHNFYFFFCDILLPLCVKRVPGDSAVNAAERNLTKQVGKNIQMRRKKLALSQERMAERIGIGQQSL